MKNLSKVTKEDAIAILSVSVYSLYFSKLKNWILTDESDNIKEPCSKLHSNTNIYLFWFMDDEISIVNTDVDVSFDTFHVDYKCYLKAHELGYYVPVLSELLNKLTNKL